MSRRERFERALGAGPEGLRAALSEGMFSDVPEVLAMVACEHDMASSGIHLEGSVWEHTLLVLAGLPEDASFSLRVAAFLHDVGKPSTKAFDPKRGRATFHSHDKAGALLVPKVLASLGFNDSALEADVVFLVSQHLRVRGVAKFRASKKAALLSHPLFPALFDLLVADDLGALPVRESFGGVEAEFRAFKAAA